jgi:glycosyltransferase involved in cell wall biosynthesis
MASGIPAIGGNKDGSVDALADGADGLAIDPEDETALGDAICDALRNPGAVAPRPNRFSVTAFRHHVQQLVASLAISDAVAL